MTIHMSEQVRKCNNRYYEREEETNFYDSINVSQLEIIFPPICSINCIACTNSSRGSVERVENLNK